MVSRPITAFPHSGSLSASAFGEVASTIPVSLTSSFFALVAVAFINATTPATCGVASSAATGTERSTSASLRVFDVYMGATDADVKRIVLGTLPSTTLAGAGIFLALNGLWMLAIAAFVACGGYIALLWLVGRRRKRDSDGSVDRAA